VCDADSFFIKQWLMPPGILLLLLLAAWWWRRAGRAWRLRALPWAGRLWLMSLPVVVQAARQLETEPPLAAELGEPGKRADAIVVLGAGRERGDPAWGGSDQPTAWPGAHALCRATGQGLRVAGADQRRPALRHAAERGAVDGRSLQEISRRGRWRKRPAAPPGKTPAQRAGCSRWGSPWWW
jgi:hypothetical protein